MICENVRRLSTERIRRFLTDAPELDHFVITCGGEKVAAAVPRHAAYQVGVMRIRISLQLQK